MPVPKSKRIANDKWDRENMSTLGCKVKKEEAEEFKGFAASQGKTANTVLKEFVQSCIAEPSTPKKESLPAKGKPRMIVTQTDEDVDNKFEGGQDKESDSLPW